MDMLSIVFNPLASASQKISFSLGKYTEKIKLFVSLKEI